MIQLREECLNHLCHGLDEMTSEYRKEELQFLLAYITTDRASKVRIALAISTR